jgi:hypothetical protein
MYSTPPIGGISLLDLIYLRSSKGVRYRAQGTGLKAQGSRLKAQGARRKVKD